MISIDKTLVVSLAIDHERRRHIEDHFGDLGIHQFHFVDAVTAEDPMVKEAYDQGVVSTYPPCFRCGSASCDCFNNVLIPQQVANWLSFRKVWKTLPADPEKYFLICEDDVAFHHNAMPLLSQFLEEFEPAQEQVLIRMSQSGLEPYQTLNVNSLSTRWGPVMSNAAYILNGAMAARLLREPFRIAQTSDNWLHGEIGAKADVHAVTLDPLLATDLSYNEQFAQFRSRIHPKGIDEEDTGRQITHVKRVDSVEEYEKLRASWFEKSECSTLITEPKTQVVPLIFVLGMHRSGTSALVRTLNLLGYQVPKDLLAANQDNPFGYWEPKSVVAFNDRLLKHFDRHWSDPKPLPIGWQSGPHMTEWIAEAVEILKALVQDSDPSKNVKGLVIKDPRLSLTFPLWRDAAEKIGVDVSCFIVYRDPSEVAQSLEARDEITLDHAKHLWAHYLVEAEQSSRGLKRGLIAYEDLLNGWQRALEECGLDLRWPSANEMETTKQKISSFLRPELRHHRSSGPSLQTDDSSSSDVAKVLSLLSKRNTEFRTQFDNVRQRIQNYWLKKSPGHAASGLSDALPARQAELSWQLYSEGKVKDAVDAAQRAVELSPLTMRYRYILGHHLDKLNRLEEAETAFREAAALDAREPRPLRALISVLKKLEHFEEAINVASSLVEMEHAVVEDHLLLAELLIEEGRSEAATSTLQFALSIYPYNAQILAKLESVLMVRQKHEAAKRIAMDAIVSDLKHAGLTETPVTQSDFRSYLAYRTVQYWGNDLLGRFRPLSLASELSDAWPNGSQLPNPKRGLSANIVTRAANKTLSVMIPVFNVNREDWLVEAINDVLTQLNGRDDAEIVIVDDASSNQVASQVASRFDAHVRCIENKKNLGLVGNHNKCIEEASGEFIHFLHQDDRVKQGFYETMLGALRSDDRLVAGFCQTGYISSSDRPENVEPVLQNRGVLEDWPTKLANYRIQFPTMLVRRRAYLELGGFSPSFNFAFDWHFWCRLCASGPVWYEPQPLAQYRVHNGSATHSFGWKDRVAEAMQVVAVMLRWVPEERRRFIADAALFKFMNRYWRLVTEPQANELSDSQVELLKFFLSGWADDLDTVQLVDTFSNLRSSSPK